MVRHALLSSALIGLAIASPSYGQQSTGWSPQPFSKPNSDVSVSQKDFVPPNRLRPTDNQQNEDVLRWGNGNRSLTSERTNRSFSQTLPVQREQPLSVGYEVAAARPTSIKPNSGFEVYTAINQVQRNTSRNEPIQLGSNVHLASHNESSNESSVEVAAPVKRSNGVWYDRSAANDNASSKITIVQKARYQESNAPAPFLPQAMPPIKKPLKENSIPDILNAIPSNPQIQPKKPNRSLLDETENIPASPFPGSKTPKEDSLDDSPSDSIEPPSIKSLKDSDPAPRPPRRDGNSGDCDAVRLLAKDLDITKLRIDSSPDFVKGIPNRNRTFPNTKDSFTAKAPIRSWLSYDGVVVAEGKLVDLRLGSVILEKADGNRTSYLLHKLSDADQAYVSENWGLPVTCSIDDRSFPRRDFADTTVTWKASGACHKPLYFEDVQLERYGHEWGPFAQPVISTAHFFGDVIVLPYKMGIHPLNECQYSLGYYRPGSCAPWTVGPVPISLRGALLQAKVITGAALVLP